MRNVLVVVYYFPPMGLSGVQRVAKFVKYLPEYGWNPVVLTVQPGGYFAYDYALLREVEQAGIEIHRTYSWDPTRLFGRERTVPLPSESSRAWFTHLSQLLFVPDNKLGWLIPALRKGDALLKENRFDLIFSSAPPYTGHLIAQRLSVRSGLPLITDFRDDWVGNPRHVYPTRLHRRLHEILEQRVLAASTFTTTINAHLAASLESRQSSDRRKPVIVIPQGYDPQDFERTPAPRSTGKMRIVHSGIFYDKQTPDVFLRGLATFLEQRSDARTTIEATFVGLFPEQSRRTIKRLGLEEAINLVGYVSHQEVPSYLLAADMLWMTIGKRPGAEGISTGKLFEYMGARKPILALVPAGAASEVLAAYPAARIVPPDDMEAVAQAIATFYDLWLSGTMPEVSEQHVRRYDRRALAGELALLFDAAVKRPVAVVTS